LDCKYPGTGFQHSHWSDQAQEIRQAQDENPTPLGKPSGDSSTNRMRELGLMHHWCLKTCRSFSPELSDIFQNHTIQLAMNHEFLMDSLLAFTCLHIAAEGTEFGPRSASILDDALRYQERALPAFRAKLVQISSSNCEALLLCSMIMMAFAAVSPFFDAYNDSETNKDSETGHTSLTSIFFFVKGIHSVIESSQPWLDKSPLNSAIQLYPKEYWTASPPTGSAIPPELRRLCDHTSLQSREIYTRAILMLENCSERDKKMTLAWVVEVGEAFVILVQEKEPLALLIYICWGALIGRSKDSWWEKLAGQTVVKRLKSLVSIEDEETSVVLNWASERIASEMS
jgi:hypothetical protein